MMMNWLDAPAEVNHTSDMIFVRLLVLENRLLKMKSPAWVYRKHFLFCDVFMFIDCLYSFLLGSV